MKVLENKTDYALDALLDLAEREKNTKRNFLFVNRLQAKHIPVSPKKALALFSVLGRQLAEEFGQKRVLVIGFAETATAIGQAVAACFSENTYYIATTREKIEESFCVARFLEEHSHATDQALFAAELAEMVLQAEQVLFVEDEVTTGKTIINFVSVLEEKGLLSGKGVCVASIVNSMQDEHFQRFEKRGIACRYLVRLDPELFGLAAMQKETAPEREKMKAEYAVAEAAGRLEPRAGVLAQEYRAAAEALSRWILEKFPIEELARDSRILVLGTEECMYPALVCGKAIEEHTEAAVFCHATTRSPIIACADQDYPIFNRQALQSLYEAGRNTFLYNLSQYDLVFVVTDAEALNGQGVSDLAGALAAYGNTKIQFVRWKV